MCLFLITPGHSLSPHRPCISNKNKHTNKQINYVNLKGTNRLGEQRLQTSHHSKQGGGSNPCNCLPSWAENSRQEITLHCASVSSSLKWTCRSLGLFQVNKCQILRVILAHGLILRKRVTTGQASKGGVSFNCSGQSS